jgi:hypothetical protein
MRNRFFGFVCWLQALILAITAVQNGNTGQTPIVVMLGALASLFVIAGFVFVANSDKHEKGETTLTLVFPDVVVNRLTEISRMSGAGDYTEVVRQALKVYDTLANVVMKDKAKIVIEMPDGERSEFVILSPKSEDDKPAPEISEDKPRDSITPQIR